MFGQAHLLMRKELTQVAQHSDVITRNKLSVKQGCPKKEIAISMEKQFVSRNVGCF